MRETAQSDRPDWSCAQRTVRRLRSAARCHRICSPDSLIFSPVAVSRRTISLNDNGSAAASA